MNSVVSSHRHLRLSALSAMFVAALAAGCASSGGSKADSAPAAAPAPAAAGATKTGAASGKVGPGMNAQGQVVDSKLVEAGYGQKVKGLNDWEGEITGKPAPGSKFSRLQIGMGMKEATDIVGQPSDQGAYLSGKAWISFYYGADRHRFELVYKGQGRLIFAGGSGFFAGGNGNLIWIIHNANEGAYR